MISLRRRRGQTLDEVVASIKGTKIAKDVNEIYTAECTGRIYDRVETELIFEQIIGEADKETGKLPVCFIR